MTAHREGTTEMSTPTASPFHRYMFEIWPDLMPAASWPLRLPEHLTVSATDADQAREFAAQAIKPDQRATLTGHVRSQCYPAHPGQR